LNPVHGIPARAGRVSLPGICGGGGTEAGKKGGGGVSFGKTFSRKLSKPPEAATSTGDSCGVLNTARRSWRERRKHRDPGGGGKQHVDIFQCMNLSLAFGTKIRDSGEREVG